MTSAGSSVAVAAVAAAGVVVLQLTAVLIRLVLTWRSLRFWDMRSQQHLSGTLRGIRGVADRLSAEEDVSEHDMEELKRLVRDLPDLDFPDSISRQRHIRRRRPSGVSAANDDRALAQ